MPCPFFLVKPSAENSIFGVAQHFRLCWCSALGFGWRSALSAAMKALFYRGFSP
jgi:hypothetical protein